METPTLEKRLLICCARTRVSANIAGEIRAIAARDDLDWDALVGGADQNALMPLLDRQLARFGQGAAPATQMVRIREANYDGTLRCLNLTAALIEILRLLKGEGINAIPYKGPVLAEQAYGEVALREFDDIDIIVRQRDMGKVHQGMMALGYIAKFPATMSPESNGAPVPGEYKYYSETRGAIAEIHTEMTLRHFPLAPDVDELWSRSVCVRVGGHDMRTFSLEDTLLALCVHGSKDFWARLSWIADVSESIQCNEALDWEQITARAKLLQVERMLHVGLLLAAGILSAPLPDTIAREAQEDRAAEAIAGEMARRLLCSEPRPPGARERFDTRRRLVPGFLAGWRYAMRLTMAPAEEDWTMVRLPRPLVPLYILLRPFRLMRKYTRPHEAA
jgi:Uncharacterised nucleotidyltransferase